MSSAQFEVLDGSILDINVTAQRRVIAGIVWGLQVDSDPDPEVIWRAKAAVEAAGYPLGGTLTNHSTMICQRMLIEPYTNDGCKVRIFYENPSFGIISAAVIRKRTYMSEHTSNQYVDQNGVMHTIDVDGWTNPANSSDKIREDYGVIRVLRPMQTIQSTILSFGAPVNGGDNLVGWVNQGLWNGYQTGFWLMTEFEIDVSKYAGYYTASAGAATRQTHDWSETVILRNERSGKFVKISTADMATLNNAATPGSYRNSLTKVPGATRVGPYPTASSGLFRSIFGV